MLEHVLKHGLELAYDIEADAFILFTETGKAYDILSNYLKSVKIKRKPKIPIFKNLFIKNTKIIIATSNPTLYKKLSKDSKIIPLFIKYREENRWLIISSAILTAVNNKILNKNDTVVCVLGKPKEVGRLDTISIIFVSEYISSVSIYTFLSSLDDEKLRKTVKEVLKLAIELGREGREGEQVGTIFVIGDTLNVMSLSKQLILNPFAGHNASIFDKNVKGTIKELSPIDGAFIITDDGKVVSAGRYLESKGNVNIPQGLGARHVAAASITKETDAIAITVSESGGIVSVFKDGKIVLEIDPKNNLIFFDDEGK